MRFFFRSFQKESVGVMRRGRSIFLFEVVVWGGVGMLRGGKGFRGAKLGQDKSRADRGWEVQLSLAPIGSSSSPIPPLKTVIFLSPLFFWQIAQRASPLQDGCFPSVADVIAFQ